MPRDYSVLFENRSYNAHQVFVCVCVFSKAYNKDVLYVYIKCSFSDQQQPPISIISCIYIYTYLYIYIVYIRYTHIYIYIYIYTQYTLIYIYISHTLVIYTEGLWTMGDPGLFSLDCQAHEPRGLGGWAMMGWMCSSTTWYMSPNGWTTANYLAIWCCIKYWLYDMI